MMHYPSDDDSSNTDYTSFDEFSSDEQLVEQQAPSPPAPGSSISGKEHAVRQPEPAGAIAGRHTAEGHAVADDHGSHAVEAPKLAQRAAHTIGGGANGRYDTPAWPPDKNSAGVVSVTSYHTSDAEGSYRRSPGQHTDSRGASSMWGSSRLGSFSSGAESSVGGQPRPYTSDGSLSRARTPTNRAWHGTKKRRRRRRKQAPAKSFGASTFTDFTRKVSKPPSLPGVCAPGPPMHRPDR